MKRFLVGLLTGSLLVLFAASLLAPKKAHGGEWRTLGQQILWLMNKNVVTDKVARTVTEEGVEVVFEYFGRTFRLAHEARTTSLVHKRILPPETLLIATWTSKDGPAEYLFDYQLRGRVHAAYEAPDNDQTQALKFYIRDGKQCDTSTKNFCGPQNVELELYWRPRYDEHARQILEALRTLK